MVKIVKTKSVLGGKPRISGTRISVDLIVSYVSSGYGIKEIKRDYPHLTREQIAAALAYIEKRSAEERKSIVPQAA